MATPDPASARTTHADRAVERRRVERMKHLAIVLGLVVAAAACSSSDAPAVDAAVAASCAAGGGTCTLGPACA